MLFAGVQILEEIGVGAFHFDGLNIIIKGVVIVNTRSGYHQPINRTQFIHIIWASPAAEATTCTPARWGGFPPSTARPPSYTIPPTCALFHPASLGSAGFSKLFQMLTWSFAIVWYRSPNPCRKTYILSLFSFLLLITLVKILIVSILYLKFYVQCCELSVRKCSPFSMISRIVLASAGGQNYGHLFFNPYLVL